MRAIMLTIFCVFTLSFPIIPQTIQKDNLVPKALLKIDGEAYWFMEPADEIKNLNTTVPNLCGAVPGMTVMTNASGTDTLGYRVSDDGTCVDSVYFLIPVFQGSCGMSNVEFYSNFSGIINEQTCAATISWSCTSGIMPGFKFFFDFNAKKVTLTVKKISNCDSCAAAVFSFASTDAQALNPVIPDKFYLSQNYPNPFNPTTRIKYSIPASLNPSKGGTLVTLKVYDILGNETVTLVNEEKSAGFYEVEFDGSNLSSGVYFYKIQTGDYTNTKKFVLMK